MMIRLSNAEINCLRQLADEPSTAAPPCPDNILKRLQDLGLVDFEPRLWAPLEAVDVRYHLTTSGEAFLSGLDAEPKPSGGKEDK